MKLFLIFGALVLVLFLMAWKSAGELSRDDARAKLARGAVVVDVRTAEEYAAGHLTNAVNLPLDTLKTTVIQRFPDRAQPILLHCRSGRRSHAAERELRALGYTNAFNIGSYQAAKRVVRPQSK
jgi:phage shock protein E